MAACARSGDPGVTPIRFSGYAGNPAETDLMKRLVADFNASHKDIRVTYEPVPGQYYPKMLTMLVAKSAPDVFYLDILYFKPFLAKKLIRPLDGYLAKSRTKRADFIPSLVDAFTAGGATYGIPKDFNAYALFYNKAHFKASGLPDPDSGWTLDRLREAARKLTVSKERYGFSYTLDIDRYLPLAMAFGGALFGPDGKCAVTSDPALAAMDYYVGLKQTDHSAVTPSELGTSWTGDAFGRGNASMVFEGGWLIPYLADSFPTLDYGITELPRGPKGRGNFLFTVAYVIPQTSKHADAAWKLIEFLTSVESQSQVTFALPSRQSVSARYAAKHPAYRPILRGAGYARPYEFGPKGDQIKDRLGVAVQEIFLGGKPPKQALAEAASEIDDMGKL